MSDCCDNCKEGKVCCSILDAAHDHDHDHSPSGGARGSRGSNARTRRMSEAKPRSNPITSPVVDAVAIEQLAHAQVAAAARSSALAARSNPAPSGQVLTPTQRAWAVRIAAVAAIGGGIALGYYGLRRAGKI